MYYNSSWRISSKLHTINQTLVGVGIGILGAICAYLFETSQLESLMSSSPYLSRFAYHPHLQTTTIGVNTVVSSSIIQSTIEGRWFQAVISLIGTVVIFKSEIKYLFNLIRNNIFMKKSKSKKL
jgi:hypothetical protein